MHTAILIKDIYAQKERQRDCHWHILSDLLAISNRKLNSNRCKQKKLIVNNYYLVAHSGIQAFEDFHLCPAILGSASFVASFSGRHTPCQADKMPLEAPILLSSQSGKEIASIQVKNRRVPSDWLSLGHMPIFQPIPWPARSQSWSKLHPR